MCVQGLVVGIYNPQAPEENIVILGRGSEYLLYDRGHYHTSNKLLAPVQATYEELLSLINPEHIKDWLPIKGLAINAFGHSVLTNSEIDEMVHALRNRITPYTLKA